MFIVYIFMNAALVAVSRSGLGIENVFTPRYKIVSISLIILIYTQTGQVCEELLPVISKFSVKRVASSCL
jgi:hypothetical protein